MKDTIQLWEENELICTDADYQSIVNLRNEMIEMYSEIADEVIVYYQKDHCNEDDLILLMKVGGSRMYVNLVIKGNPPKGEIKKWQ